jgi:hypothetical protein
VGIGGNCNAKGTVAVDGVLYFLDYWRGGMGGGAECAGKEFQFRYQLNWKCDKKWFGHEQGIGGNLRTIYRLCIADIAVISTFARVVRTCHSSSRQMPTPLEGNFQEWVCRGTQKRIASPP